MDDHFAPMAIRPDIPYGRRVLQHLVDERARQSHLRPFASIPVSNDVEDGYRDISYFQFANAVNRCAHYLMAALGPSTSFEPVIYLGPSDLRYQILALAAPKAGYSVCFTSHRNTVETHLGLVDDSRARFIASPSRRHNLVSETLKQRKLKHVVLPELDLLLDENFVTEVHFGLSHDFLDQLPWILLQTIDETGKPELRMLRHGFASAIDAWSLLTYNDAEHRYGQKRVFCSVPFIHITGLINTLITIIWLDSTIILPPPLPLTADLVNRIHIRGNASATILSPSIITELATAPESKQGLQQMQAVTYTGGILPKTVGDSLSFSTALVASIDTPEIGALPILPTPSNDWEYSRFNSEFGGIQFRKHTGSNEMFELVIINTNRSIQVHPVFSTFPGIRFYETKHLFTPHPTERDLWRFAGRTDNVITLGTGEEINPVFMESVISASPHVNACVVIGHGRPRPCLLIEPESQTPPQDQQKLLDRIWPVIEKANRDYPKLAQIERSLVLFTYPDIPLDWDESGNVRRVDAYKIYKPDINTLYNNRHDDWFKDVLDLDFDTAQSATLSLLFLFRKKFGLANMDANDNFHNRGFDSMDVLTLVRLINAGYPPVILETKDVYEYQTPRNLAQYISHDPKATRQNSLISPPTTVPSEAPTLSYSKAPHTVDEVFTDDAGKPLPVPPSNTLFKSVKKFLNKRDNYAEAPPNGGITAWLQILGCFCISMNNMGLASAFGVFQAYYRINLLAHETESRVSWIGTSQAALTLLIGVLSGPLFDKGYFFSTLITASIGTIVSFLMLSLATEYYQIILCQGILLGICSGLLYIPSIAQVPQYFTTKRGLAVGIVTAGAPFGGILYPLVLRQLLEQHGFTVACRGLSGLTAIFLVISWIVIKPLRLKHQIQKKKRDPTMFRDKAYLSFCAAAFLLFCGVLTPYILSATYFFEIIRPDTNMAFYCVVIVNAGNIFGRIVPNWLSDRGWYPEVMLSGSAGVLVVLGFSWTAIKSETGYIVFLVLWGFFSGPIAALPATILPHITPSLEVFATRLGLIYAMAGVGVLIGTPICTAIDNIRAGTSLPFLGSQVWVGVTAFLGMLAASYTGWYGVQRVRAIKAKAKLSVEMKGMEPAEQALMEDRV